MARAYSVWIIMVRERPAGAFTVKHELLTQLECQWGDKCPAYVRVLRLPDNGGLNESKDVTAEVYGFK